MKKPKRTANTNARQYTSLCTPFKGSNLSADWHDHLYIVLSYGWWPLFIYSKATGVWYRNNEKYSPTTSKHARQAEPVLAPGCGFLDLSCDVLRDIVK